MVGLVGIGAIVGLRVVVGLRVGVEVAVLVPLCSNCTLPNSGIKSQISSPMALQHRPWPPLETSVVPFATQRQQEMALQTASLDWCTLSHIVAPLTAGMR